MGKARSLVVAVSGLREVLLWRLERSGGRRRGEVGRTPEQRMMMLVISEAAAQKFCPARALRQGEMPLLDGG